MKPFAVALLLLISTAATGFQPRTGHWNNLAEGGTGYNIDIQNGVLIVTLFSYKTNGDSEWYLASGPMTNGQRNFTGTLDKYRGGQCVSCAHTTPAVVGNDGTISFNFTSETSAIVTLGGRSTTITPYNFGYGNPPQGMLGEWVFVYDIIITFADRFTFTGLAAGTSTGNGLAVDTAKIAGCELQTSGTFAGQVFCADGDSAGNLQGGYVFVLGIDETFGGTYVAASGNLYPMKGFRISGSSGNRKAAMDNASDGKLSAVKSVQDAFASGQTKASPELLAALATLAARIRPGVVPD